MNPTLLINEATTHFDNKAFDEALKCLNAYILAEPRASVGYYNRGIIFRIQGKYDKALAEFDTAIRFAPRHPDAYQGRGDVHREQKQYAQAVIDYSKALSLDPKRLKCYALRGEAHYQIKKYTEALADFNKGLPFDHEEPSVYYLRGLTYLALMHHEKALDDLNIAIRIGPKDHRFYLGRALVYWPLLEYRKAMDDLNRAVALAAAPDALFELYLRRAELNLLRGHPLGSLADYLRSEQRRPDHRAVLYRRPLRTWATCVLNLSGLCVKSLLGHLVYKPFLCFVYERFLAFPMLSFSLDMHRFVSLHYRGLTVTFIVDGEGKNSVDQEFYQRAADCFIAACDAPDAPNVMKETRDYIRKMIILNLDFSIPHHRLMKRNTQGRRMPIFGSLLKTTDLTVCTQFFAEELVWFFFSRRDYYNIRFWLFSAENIKPRAWVSYRQQKPEIDAYLERFCKAKLAEYQKSPEKPRLWPYYGTKA